MPMYDFVCQDCGRRYEDLVKLDPTGEYPGVSCPQCKSESKKWVPSSFAFNFTNPVGTDRWVSDGTGHDYRYNYVLPSIRAKRQRDEQMSHMGADPYNEIDDTQKYDVGIHDVEPNG